MADITATATLNTQQFSKGLQTALRDAKRWKGQVQRELGFDPLQRINFAVRELKGQLQGARGLKLTINTGQAEQSLNRATQATSRQRRELTETEQAVIKYRNATLALRNEIEAGVVSQREGIATARRLRDESLQASRGAERWSTEYRNLLVASGRADRTLATLEGRLTKLGLSQNVAIASTRGLADSFTQLAGAMSAVFVTAGLTRYTRSLIEFSREGAAAHNTMAVFFMQLEKDGESIDKGARRVAQLAAQFQTTEDAVAQGITQLVRYGATLDQAVHILQRGGASALAAGKTAAQGFEAVTQAIVGEMSVALNRIGIAGNLSTAYVRLARDLGTTADQLTTQQKIMAVINDTLVETDTEYEALSQTLAGFVGSVNKSETAWTRFRRALGKGAETFLAPLLGAATAVMNAFISLPEPIQRVVTTTALLGVTVGVLGIAYATLRTVLGRVQIVQTLVNALVARETAARTRLGGMLLVLAGRYKLLTREQIVNTVASRDAVRGVTLWGTALQGLKTGFATATKGLVRFTAAGVRFIASPIGLTLAAIAAAFILVRTAVTRNKAIIEPALKAVEGSVASLAKATQPLKAAFQALFAEGSVLANFFKNVLITIAREVALVMARFSLALDRAAISIQFLQDLVNEGPRKAWANLQAAALEAQERFEALTATIHETTQGVRDGTIATGEWGDELDLTGDEAEDTAEQLAKLQKQAEDTARSFQERLKDIRIGLMPEGEARDIAATREEFLRLRNAIRAAAEENEQFKPFERMLLAESFELEQAEILRIQEEYAEQRAKEAAEQAQELAEAIRDGERRVVDEQTRDQLNAVEALTLTYQRRVEDTNGMYDRLIERAREYGQDTTRLEELRTAELLAIQTGYERDVTAAYDRIYETVSDRQRELVRAVLDARGDDRGLLGIDFDRDMRDITTFYADARREAAGNAELLTTLEAQEAAERMEVRRRYWDGIMTLTRERAEAVLERERDIAKQRAELAGDRVALARQESASEIREINSRYDELEAAAAGNASELARIAELRNQELALANERLARNLKDLSDEAQADAFKPLIDSLTSGLDEATRETTRGIETQLRAWKAAYGENAEVVKLVDAALTAVAERNEKLAEETTKLVREAAEASRDLVKTVAADDAARGLSEVEELMASAAERAAEIREQQERNNKLLAQAVGIERQALLDATAELDNALAVISRNVAEDAERITRAAIAKYQDGLAEAAREASEAAARLVETDVQRVISGIADVQTNALQEARTALLREIASLTASGLDTAALAPLRAQVAEIDALLSRQARVMADFADDQYQHLRSVAEAVLEQTDAQRVANQTYVETIRLRRAALAEAVRERAGVDEIAQATRNLTDSQLAYLDSLQRQVSELRALKGEYAGIYSAANDLSQLLNRPLPATVIDAQEKMAVAALEQVLAAQEAGVAYAEYNDDLRDALGLWREFENISTTAMRTAAEGFRREFITEGLMPNENRIRDVAVRMADAFGILTSEAQRRLNEFIRGDLADPFEGLEFTQPFAFADIFSNLNKEAANTPEVIAGIDEEINTLEQQVRSLKDEIAAAVNFDAAGEQLISGYQAVIDQVIAVTGETFASAGTHAVQAFNQRLREEQERLQEELEDTIGAAAAAAGATAGAGLMSAFAAGIRSNEALVLNAVESVLEQVRARLPSSDAKKGPLSDLTHSGRMLLRTWVRGAESERSRLASSMNRLLQVARPSAAFTAATSTATAGPVNVNVDGRRNVTPGTLALNARALVNDVERELRLRGR